MERREFLSGAAVALAATVGGVVWPQAADASQRSLKPAPSTKPQRFVIGHSTKGRPISAYLIGERDAPSQFLVMGQMHGDEPAGPLVCRNRLLKADPVRDVALWVVPTMNPDGGVRGTRVNARGVDLNRNFPSKTWVRQDKGTRYYSGPRPASEPETRAIIRFFSRVAPFTIISMHQPLAAVDFSGGDPDVTHWLSRHLQLPVSHIQINVGGGGTMTSWFNHEFRKKTAVTVELPRSTTPEYRDNVAHALHRFAAVRRG